MSGMRGEQELWTGAAGHMLGGGGWMGAQGEAQYQGDPTSEQGEPDPTSEQGN